MDLRILPYQKINCSICKAKKADELSLHSFCTCAILFPNPRGADHRMQSIGYGLLRFSPTFVLATLSCWSAMTTAPTTSDLATRSICACTGKRQSSRLL